MDSTPNAVIKPQRQSMKDVSRPGLRNPCSSLYGYLDDYMVTLSKEDKPCVVFFGSLVHLEVEDKMSRIPNRIPCALPQGANAILELYRTPA